MVGGNAGHTSTQKRGVGKAPGARGDGKKGKTVKPKQPAAHDASDLDDPMEDALGALQHGDMTWRMLISSPEVLLRGDGVRAVSSTVPMEDCVDSAEYSFLQKSEAELTGVEQGAVEARIGENL